MTKFSKAELRAQIFKELAALEPQVFHEAGVRAVTYLKPYLNQQAAIFKSLSNEIDTRLLIKNFQSVLLPGPDPETYAREILRLNIRLVLVPGLAFDLQG